MTPQFWKRFLASVAVAIPIAWLVLVACIDRSSDGQSSLSDLCFGTFIFGMLCCWAIAMDTICHSPSGAGDDFAGLLACYGIALPVLTGITHGMAAACGMSAAVGCALMGAVILASVAAFTVPSPCKNWLYKTLMPEPAPRTWHCAVRKMAPQ